MREPQGPGKSNRRDAPAVNSHLMGPRHVVLEAIGACVGRKIAELLSESPKETVKIVYYRTAANSAEKFLSPIILAGFKKIGKTPPVLDIYEVPDTSDILCNSTLPKAKLQEAIRQSREKDLRVAQQFLAGSQGADLLFFDSILGAGSKSNAKAELDAALSLIRPGGHIVYLHDSACMERKPCESKAMFPGEERERFIREATLSMMECVQHAAQHIDSQVTDKDAGRIAGECTVPTSTIRARLGDYLKLNPISGDLSAFFSFAGMGAVQRQKAELPPGLSTIHYSGHILFAKKHLGIILPSAPYPC